MHVGNDCSPSVVDKFISGEIQLVYMSSEALLTVLTWREMFRNHCYQDNLICVAVDEVQCVCVLRNRVYICVCGCVCACICAHTCACIIRRVCVCMICWGPPEDLEMYVQETGCGGRDNMLSNAILYYNKRHRC